ncbi:MAG: hypothetical protein ACD_58C00247G0001 [uncultured bacterium]|nr:MAG: hypothetical protein ACD_58C00247G0001 [uncultured bacterium]
MSTTYSIGAMNQLGDALENAGFSTDDVTRLKQFSNLKGLKDILYGKAEIKYLEQLIDCDSMPFIPNGWSVKDHKKGGFFKFDPAKISLYLSKKQNKGSVGGRDLLKDLADKLVINANVLDYLLAHPELIPEEWKGKFVFFWGTIYRDSDGDLHVRCLNWDGSKWIWIYGWLDYNFYSGSPAALAS